MKVFAGVVSILSIATAIMNILTGRWEAAAGWAIVTSLWFVIYYMEKRNQ